MLNINNTFGVIIFSFECHTNMFSKPFNLTQSGAPKSGCYDDLPLFIHIIQYMHAGGTGSERARESTNATTVWPCVVQELHTKNGKREHTHVQVPLLPCRNFYSVMSANLLLEK